MIGGHVRVNLIGDETGYGLNQMYLDGKTRASIGGAVQYQPRAACGGAVTTCSLKSGGGAAGVVNDYKFFGGDAFLDAALGGDLEFAVSASIARWDYGSNAGQTGFNRTGTGITGAPQPLASLASSPPLVTTTMRPPLIAASDAASMVSSVLPENEMANTNEPSPTKCGHS